VIVLFSDMIHESEDFTFSTSTGPSDGQIEKILDELSNRNRFPDLTNCKVFVNGSIGKTTPQVENIKNFWYRFSMKQKVSDIGL
ncbi:MAG: hypothetical protein JXB49_13735, partial [Bacteroidales bacterium]|nr:hypothetical protein [Bacteroidales bacterium]